MPTVITTPKITIDPSLLERIKDSVQEKGQVVVHVLMENKQYDTLIRIWPSTYLYDHHSDHTSELVHAENISYFPIWTQVHQGEYFFTLIFTGLPKSCSMFDLIELCSNQAGAFKVMNIPRTETDVYFVQM